MTVFFNLFQFVNKPFFTCRLTTGYLQFFLYDGTVVC